VIATTGCAGQHGDHAIKPVPAPPLQQQAAHHDIIRLARRGRDDLHLMNPLKLLAQFGLTGQIGPIYPGVLLTDLATRLGPPWDIGRISKRNRWPHLFAYGDVEVVACRCRTVTHISIQVHRCWSSELGNSLLLPAPAGGMHTLAPGQLTFEQVTASLDGARCRWRLHDHDLPDQPTLRTEPVDAWFVFVTKQGSAPVLYSASVSGASHECPPVPPGRPDDGLGT
jgi:hypothetical protein